MRSTTKYLVIALWCTYEILSVAIAGTLYLATREYFGVSPLTGLAWLLSRHIPKYPLTFVILFYTGFIIIGFFLGWLFFISERIKNPRTRTIVILIFLSIVVCFLALLFPLYVR